MPALSSVCAGGVRPYELSAHFEQITAAAQSACSAKWKEIRGIEMFSLAIGSLTVAPEDAQTVKQTQRAKALTDPALAAGTLTAAQADAMRTAAANPAGTSLGAVLLAGAAKPSLWCCSCGKWTRGNFCEHCGKARK